MVRVGYATTFEECLDVHERMYRRIPLYRRERSRQLWWTGVSFATAMTVVAGTMANAPIGIWVFGVAAFAAILAWPFSIFYGRWYYDPCVRRQARAAVVHMLGNTEPIDFQVELREDTAWTVQNGFELAFPWRSATEVRDAGDGIEIWFASGLVLVRNRGFSSIADRERFVTQAQALLATQQPMKSG
jgi:hypothetical protein